MIHLKKKSKSVTTITLFLVMVTVFSCFTTACQPTPDAPIVVGKGDNLNNLIQSTSNTSNSVSPSSTLPLTNDALYTKLAAPKHWNFKETALDGKLNIAADADIKLPGASKLPAATATLSEFTQEDLDKIAIILGVNGAAWTEAGVRTKEEIEAQLINARAELSKLKSENNPEEVRPIEDMETMIKNIEQEYNNAPHKSELKHVEFKIGNMSYGKELNGKDMTGVGFKGSTLVNGQPFSFFAGSAIYSDSVRTIRACFGSNPSGFGGVNIDKPYGVSLTKEQAATQASAIAKQLTDELTLCYVAPAAMNKQETSRNWGWACVFMREINGCPTAYESTDEGSNIESEVKNPVPYEKMIIVMDDKGMVSFEWETPMKIKSIDNPDVSLLSFDKISQRAKEQVIQSLGYEATGKKDGTGKDVSDPGVTAKIIKVELGLMRIAKTGSDGYYYIPVWNFFADIEHTPEYLNKLGTKPSSQDKFVDKDGNPQSIADGYPQAGIAITINALDGSVINRTLGY